MYVINYYYFTCFKFWLEVNVLSNFLFSHLYIYQIAGDYTVKAIIKVKYFWYRPGPGLIIS